jgi:gas vesicle protein
MSDGNGSGAFLTGFIIGGLVGAAAALLWTPQSGEKTRLQLQERSIELKTQIGDATAEARGQAGKFATGLQERSKDLIEQAQSGRATAETPSDEEEPAADEESDAKDAAA